MEVPTVLMARTDANSAKLLTSDVDPRDHEFIFSKERTAEGFFRIKGGLEYEIARGLLLMHSNVIFYGAKHQLLTWVKHTSLLKQSMKNTLTKCWLTTVLHLSTGVCILMN